jgi:hypothetical protein
LYGSAGLALSDKCAGTHLIALHHILNTQMDEVAAPQLAVDRQVKKREIANAV